VPLTSLLAIAAGGWHTVFVAASAMSLTAAALALFVLKPMRNRMLAAQP